VNIALISLSSAGARIAAHLAAKLPTSYAAGQQVLPSPPVGEGLGVRGGDEQTPKFFSDDAYETARISCEVFLHVEAADAPPGAVRFERIAELTRELFPRFQGLVYIAPVGLVVRAVAPCLQHKTTDPGVVVVDVGARWAVSLVGGHEGGANRLAVAVANILGAEAVVTTSTEAAKDLIVGVGCRRGTSAEAIVAAVRDALAAAACPLDRVRLLATAELKADEAGLREAARQLQVPLRWIADDEIRATRRVFESSPLVQEKVDLPAVAEPAALLAGRRTRLLLPKMIRNGVTVAIAREDCMPWA
jgi:cobalt-precorrin 5A hydrolase